MYQIYSDSHLVFDSRREEYTILSGSVTLEDNRSAKMSFKIRKDNPAFQYLERMVSTIYLWGEDSEPIFKGRIIDDTEEFNGDVTFTCEGELSFLVDSIQRPFDFGDSPSEYFKYFINNHNAQVNTNREMAVGSVTVTDPNNYIARSNSFYENTWENVRTRLLEPLGGHLVITHTNSGATSTLNWYADYPSRTTQEIRFGENLLGFKKELDSAQIATAIIPLGARYTDSNDQEHRLTIEEVNDGEDYVYNADAVAQYGWIFKVVEWDDVTVAANLKTKAEAYLEDIVQTTVSIELSAADLSALDQNINEFRLGDLVHIVSTPHGIDASYLLTTQKIDLLHPETNSITLGHVYKTFTGNAANVGQTAAAARSIALAQSARVDAVHERAVDAQEVAAAAMPKFGECRSTAGTQAKANYQTISNFELEPGATVALLMKYANSINNPTLNINGTGAKPIVIADGTALTASNSAVIGWVDDSLIQFVYDGTNWRIDDSAALTRIQHILTEDVVGTNGWINLAEGCFNFGPNKLVFDSATQGQAPTLSLDGTVESTNGHIGGWEIGSHLLSSSSTVSGSTYQAFMQEANGSTRVNSFGVSKTTNGTTTYPFRVTYDGTLYATGANISGTVSTNALTATGGTIGSWDIGTNLLSTSVTINGTTYTPFMQVPNGDTVVNAFGVTASSGGTTAYPFRVTYDGTLYSTKLNASGGTIGGWTIGNSILYGETLAYETYGTAIAMKNFRTFIQIPDGSNSYYSFGVLNETDNVYPFRVTYDGTLHTEHLDATGGSIGGWNIGSTLLSVDFNDGTYDYQAYIQAPNGTTRTNAFGIRNTSMSTTTFSVDYEGKLTAGSITEGGTTLANKYCLKPVGMAAAGANTPVPTATWTAYTPGGNNNLPNGHRYLCIVNAEFPSSTTGIRALRATIDGTSVGNIATDRRTPISGYSTYCRIEFWIEPGSSVRTLAFEAYQNTGSQQTVTFRYQLIDFGT